MDLPAAAVIASAGMVTAGLGARAAHALSPKTLQMCLGIFMVLVAPTMPLKQDILDFVRAKRAERVSDADFVRAKRAERVSDADVTIEAVDSAPVGVGSEKGAGPGNASPIAIGSTGEFAETCFRYLKSGVLLIGVGSGFLGGLFGVGGGGRLG